MAGKRTLHTERPKSHSQRLRLIVFAVILLVGIVYAWHLRWVSEDAYISLRYARNLVEGHGLVFNIGESVEGYTNFLWTLLLAMLLAFALKPAAITAGLGLLFTGLSFCFLLRVHRRMLGGQVLLPAALGALALNYTWASFSTSGLETSLISALLSSVFLVLSETSAEHGAERQTLIYCAAAGILTALAVMTRPDGILIIPGVLVFFLLQAMLWKRRMICVLVFSLSLAAIYLPYFLWRFTYYGYFFPNTFYAKAASSAYYSQGLIYSWEFMRRYFLWLLLPWTLVAAALAVRRKSSVNPLVVTMATYCAVHAFYVIRIGGDFMEGRFFVPILPFLYLLIEHSFRFIFPRRALLITALLAMITTVAINREVIEPGKIYRGITDERSWAHVFDLWYREGTAFGQHLPADTIIATDAIGAFGYASRLPIVDTLGLTDETVAHQPIVRRLRPGHEKFASMEYLTTRKIAVIRDGMGLYFVRRRPHFRYAGNRYFLMSSDQTIADGFKHAIAELRSPDK